MVTHRLQTEINQAVVEFIDAGRPFALAVVLRGLGSTPRKAGTKAIIDASGSIWGTIGGGLLESERSGSCSSPSNRIDRSCLISSSQGRVHAAAIPFAAARCGFSSIRPRRNIERRMQPRLKCCGKEGAASRDHG